MSWWVPLRKKWKLGELMPAKRKSAFSAVLREAQQQSETVTPSHSETGVQQDGLTVIPLEGEAVEPLHGTTVTPLDREAGAQQHSSTVGQSNSEAVEPSSSDAVTLSHRETVEQLDRETVKVKKERKVSFYLTPEQENKLYVLEFELYLRTKKRLNRNEIVRYLIDHCNIDELVSGLSQTTS
jgi:hypothetical protein